MFYVEYNMEWATFIQKYGIAFLRFGSNEIEMSKNDFKIMRFSNT